MKTAFLSAAFFLASAAGLWAANPPMITKQPESATFAKSATGRFYVSAASTDGGYLTYQWRRSGPFTTPLADPNGANRNIILLSGAPDTAGTGTSATLTTATPADSGYYYYWAEITNTKDGETAFIESAIVMAKVVNRTLHDHITNSDFSTLYAPNGKNTIYWTNAGSGVSGQYTIAAQSRLPDWKTTDFYAPLSNVANFGDVRQAFQVFNFNKKPFGYYAASDTDAVAEPANPTPVATNPTSTTPQNTQTHLYANDGAGHGDNGGSTGNFGGIELANAYPSSVYQEVATMPGKIYEWSLQHSARNTPGVDVMVVIIGEAVNERADLGADTSLWENDGVEVLHYPYGASSNHDPTKSPTYFYKIADALAKREISATAKVSDLKNNKGQNFTQEYNGHVYYLFIIATGPGWQTYSGLYTVPSGQGTTVFSFVGIEPTGAGGNVLDNIVFASGSPISSEQEVSFTSEAQLSATTKPGYAYGLAEIRGSTATPLVGSAAAYYDADGAGVDSTEAPITANASGWYIQTFDTTGVITFKNLTPGKVYRIVGIPAAAISAVLKVNERPEYVLDEDYYANMRILPVSAGDTATVWNIDLEAVGMKARATIKNARSDVEYALLDSVGGGVVPVHAWTTSDSKGRVRFDNLTLDTVYYLVVRPLGYGEVTYAEAAEAAVKVRTPSPETPELKVAHIARPTYTTITIDSTKTDCDYAAVDTKTGHVVEQQQGVDGTMLRFENLDERKAYQMVIRYPGGSWLKGVRVYPYPSRLYIDYVNETVRSSADSTGNIPVNVEYRIQRKKK